MNSRLALVSAAALAWADAAAAQPAAMIQPGGAPGIVNEGQAVPAALPAPPAAPVTTDILADRNNPLALGTRVTQAGREYVIDGGTRARGNLFHSFSRFDLGRGDLARWVQSGGDSAGIFNVINRVTGGDPSNIEGIIDTTALPNARFYFINPAGIVFGEGAQLNVPAAAHFATANALRFTAGPDFTVTTPGGSTFSVSDPQAFGFVGGQGNVSLDRVGPDFLPRRGPLTLAGSNITVTDSNLLGSRFRFESAGDGVREIRLMGESQGRGGAVLLDRSTIRLNFAPASSGLGILLIADRISVDDTKLGTDLQPGASNPVGGQITIDGRDVRVTGSILSASSFGFDDANDIRILADDLVISASMLATETQGDSLGGAGSVALTARTIRIAEGSRISTSTATEESGGDLSIEGGRITIDNSVLAAEALPGARGQGGKVQIRGDLLELVSGARISSSTSARSSGGGIDINMSDAVTLRRSSIESRSQPGARGNAGSVIIRVPLLEMVEGSTISTGTFSRASGGLISIDSASIRVGSSSRIESRSEAGATGDAGLILLRGGSLLLTGHSSVRSDTESAGGGGNIIVRMTDVELRDGGSISSDSNNGRGTGGAAGNIVIEAGRLAILDTNASRISSSTVTDADAGSIKIDAGDLVMNRGRIVSQTQAAGDAGSVTISAARLRMENGAEIGTSARPCAVGCSAGVGDAGEIEIAVGGALNVLSSSQISSAAGGTGAAGMIAIKAGTVTVGEGGRITSGTDPLSTGTSGRIGIETDELLVTDGAIQTNSNNANRAGDIGIVADEVRLVGSASIASANLSAAPGSAGTVLIETGNLTLTDGAQITTSSRAGPAGDILISMPGTGLLTLESSDPSRPSLITTSSGPGTGGVIAVSRPRAIISNGGSILALGEQGGANVQLDSQYLISSSDRLNRIEVSGNFLLEAIAYDVSAGTVNRDISVIDASGVLRGQCAAVRQTGQVSQLVVRPIGPYGTRPISAAPDSTRLLTAAELQPSCS